MSERMINILYFTSFFYRQGGASKSLVKLVGMFDNDNFKACAVVPENAKTELDEEDSNDAMDTRWRFFAIERISRRLVNPLHLIAFLFNAIMVIIKLRKEIRAHKIDVVHANDMRDFHAPLAAWSCGVPVVWHLRACKLNPLVRYTFGMLMHFFATRIVSVSNAVAQNMTLEVTRMEGRVTVIHNPGPYRELFHPQVSGSAIRDELSIAPTAPVVTMIGKLSLRKGHRVFVQAIPKILKKNKRTKFLIVGGKLEGHESYATELVESTKEYARNQQLFFLDERSDIPEIVAASDVLVHCSLFHDPFPGVVLEGMAMGKVVVAANAGGVPEQITDKEDGLLFQMGDAGDLAAKVFYALSHENEMKQLRQRAVENMNRKFNFARFQNQLTQVYYELIDSSVDSNDGNGRHQLIGRYDLKAPMGIENPAPARSVAYNQSKQKRHDLLLNIISHEII